MSSRTRRALIVGSPDAAIERMVAACGLETSSGPTSQLATLAHPASHVPDLLILDLRGQAELPAAVQPFRRNHPRVGVLVLASALDPAVMLEAMRAGVSEWLTEPIAQEGLGGAIERLSAPQADAQRGQVYAFIGAKGGVGTTTIAVNVASALAQLRRKTLLVDLHLTHGDTALFLGTEPRFSVVDALENTQRFDEAFFGSLVTKTKAGPDLLPSANHGHTVNFGGPRIRSLVEFATGVYDFVVLDVPRSDASALDALDLATSIVVVANQELATARGASRIVTSLRQRYGADRIRVIVTRYDPKADIGQSDVERVTGSKVLNVVPNDYRTAVDALNRGKPLVVDNSSALAHSYVTIARSLARVGEETEVKGGSASLIGRLTGWRRTQSIA